MKKKKENKIKIWWKKLKSWQRGAVSGMLFFIFSFALACLLTAICFMKSRAPECGFSFLLVFPMLIGVAIDQSIPHFIVVGGKVVNMSNLLIYRLILFLLTFIICLFLYALVGAIMFIIRDPFKQKNKTKHEKRKKRK